MKKTGPNLRSMLSVLKSLALGKKKQERQSHAMHMQIVNVANLLTMMNLVNSMDVECPVRQEVVKLKISFTW